jgi:hypothetical protein
LHSAILANSKGVGQDGIVRYRAGAFPACFRPGVAGIGRDATEAIRMSFLDDKYVVFPGV